jgi:uncharacterized protein (DUF427 family)
MMATASFKQVIIAQTKNFIEVENSIYFPRSDVVMAHLVLTSTTTRCPWKGTATYYNVELLNEVAEIAAWSYQNPKSRGKRLRNYVAFWKDIIILR